jgi:cysteine desulfurase/selenocysteine lyase
MPPFLSGGEMISSVSLRRTTFNTIPHKFEAGTPDIAAAIGLGAAVRYLGALGMDSVAAHELALTEYALDMLPREVPGFALMGSPDPSVRAGIVTFTLPDVHAHDVATLLDRVAVAIRAGHHCTQPLHERLGVAATGRASFNVYSDRDHLDRLAVGLRDVMRVFAGAGRQHPVGDVPGGDASATRTADAVRDAVPTAPVSAGGPS